MVKNLKQIESSKQYKAAIEVAQYLYSILGDLPADERYSSISKLRNKANDILYNVSIALSNNTAMNNEIEWAFVKKDSVAALTIYDFVISQEYIKSNASFRKNLTYLIMEADKHYDIAEKLNQKLKQDELESWNERYSKWKEMQSSEG